MRKRCEFSECGKIFDASNPAKRFCCRACKELNHVRRMAAGHIPQPRVARVIPERDCEMCGTTFQPWPQNPDQRFCSRPCAVEARRGIPTARCRDCGVAFHRKRHEVRCPDCLHAPVETQAIACAGCIHGIPSTRSEFGYECRIWAAMRCKPHTAGALRQEARTG